MIKICEYCGKEYKATRPNQQKFCSKECKYKSRYEQTKEAKCDNCGTIFQRSIANNTRYKNIYCSLKCELEFKYKKSHEKRICEICGEEFECLKSSKKRFCSIRCQAKWQSIYLVGKNANGYKHDVTEEKRIKVCEWCGKNFKVRPYQINENIRRFCSEKCSREWFSKIYSQTEEFKQKSRKRAVEILENGYVSETNTKAQVIINKLLEELNINYINEKGFEICAADNYLNDYNLIIEVMGTFWHVDVRFYKNINYDIQVDRIKRDKIKHTYIKNNYNIEILYLWEYDIINNLELCKKLIQLYIKNKGILLNYHSFNYNLDKNGNVILRAKIIKPYMEWEKSELSKIIDIQTKEKMSRKQLDKWITFKCEYCGKEKEQLISKYNKRKHHYCSKECSSNSRINRIEVQCNYCGEKINVKPVDYHRHKTNNFYCNKNCERKFNEQKTGVKSNNGYVEFNCEQCGQLSKCKTGDYNRRKHHFCSRECYNLFRTKK